MRLFAAAPCLALLALVSCSSSGLYTNDPTVIIQTPLGSELGVSTDYGIVFTGQGAQSGSVQLTAWFSDGPSFESGLVEPVGGGLFRTETQIELPRVPISFDAPDRGDDVTVRGRRGRRTWEISAEIARHPAVTGVLLRQNSQLRDLKDDSLGAGVYVGSEDEQVLVGLVSGRVSLSIDGGTRTYVTVIGAPELWRLITYTRNKERERRWNYREDLR